MVDKIIILGKYGQVASNLKYILGNKAICLGTEELNLLDDNIPKILSQYEANIIINAAAYTKVDDAEKEDYNAYKINSDAPGILAEYTKKNNILLLHYSTDYLFSGKDIKEIDENDIPDPLSIYGKSKLLGEQNIKYCSNNYLIIRTSAIFDHKNHNFVKTMLNLAKEKKEIKVINDQFTSPTYAFDLAQATIKILSKLNNKENYETLNICNEGSTSWYNFAKKIFKIANEFEFNIDLSKLISINSSEYKTLALRPKYSILSTKKLFDKYSIKMPNWQNALKQCIININKYEFNRN